MQERRAAGRSTYRAVMVWFVVVFVAMVWPAAVPFARARPLVLGMPFSLFYYACLLVASFCVLLGLYRWEISRGLGEDDGDDA